MSIRSWSLRIPLLILLPWLGAPHTVADLIADPDALVGYTRGDRIDDAFPGMTLSVGVRNWSRPSGSWVRYVTGHAVLGAYPTGDAKLGWELATVIPDGGTVFGTVDRYGSQNAAGSYSADSIYLVVRLEEPTDTIWVDVSNPGGSSNRGLGLTAYDSAGKLGVRVAQIGSDVMRVEYVHPTPDIEYFIVDIAGSFWKFPIDAVGVRTIPEPSALGMLGIGLLLLGTGRCAGFR